LLQLCVEVGAVKGARPGLHRYVVAGLRRNRVMKGITGQSRLERVIGLVLAVMLHIHDRHIGAARPGNELGDPSDDAITVMRRKIRSPHALLHVDDDQRLAHDANSVRGVHFAVRRAMRPLTSSPPKSLAEPTMS